MRVNVMDHNRKTGIEILAEAPWGTHLCLFYDSRDDLLNSLSTYYKEGLEHNERCIWVTADPINVEDAKKTMSRVIPDFYKYLDKGQMEIFHYDEWYTKGGSFDIGRTLKAWIDKHDRALEAGYDGTRVSGNTTWIEDHDWHNFVDYEEEINRVIGQFRMIVLCTYSLERCNAQAAMDVIRHHQYALVKKGGFWDLVQSSEQKLMDNELRRIEWLLRKSVAQNTARSDGGSGYLAALEDAAPRNRKGLILESVGRDVLLDLVTEHLDLLETSAAVFEETGDCALRLIASGWCRLLNNVSHNKCKAGNAENLSRSGGPSCHGFCWNDASRVAIETGEPVDIKCPGGLRVYAIPIRSNQEIIGAASVCYGDPPMSADRIDEIAGRFGVDKRGLLYEANKYESRPRYVIEMAKYRISAASRLIGEIVQRRQAEDRTRRQNSILSGINRIFNETLQSNSDEDVARTFLHIAEEITGSESGFIGELDKNGSLACIAMINRGEPSRKTSKEGQPPDDLEIRGTWGKIIKEGKAQFMNDPCDFPGNTGASQGTVRNFLGVPLRYEDNIIGIICLANKEDEYTAGDLEIIDALSPAFVESLKRKRRQMEIARLSDTLRQRAIELEIINHELESFSYSISHDLRAPLRGIDGFSLALLEEYGDKFDEKGKAYLKYVRSETQHMAGLIDDLLSLSRVTRAQIKHEKVSLSDIACEIMERLKKDYQGRQVETIISPGITVTADPTLIRAVLENLLENAWKFTSKSSSAKIEFGMLRGTKESSDAGMIYFVRDNGAGFNMKYKDKLFSAFQRLHSDTEFPGNGIGLATVNRIIHRHGGSIWAEATTGKGATFYFTLQRKDSEI